MTSINTCYERSGPTPSPGSRTKFIMLSVIPSILLLASAATCAEVLYLHLSNLHPHCLPKSIWPRVYDEIMLPIAEDLLTLNTKNPRWGKMGDWISCLFPNSGLQEFFVARPRNADAHFKPGQLILPGAPLFKNDSNEIVLANKLGLVVHSRFERREKFAKEATLALWFDPEMPCYDVCHVLKYFDDYKIPRPAPLRIIPERISYHPSYSPQPPFDSSEHLFYMVGITYQLLDCIFHGKLKTIEGLFKFLSSRNLSLPKCLLEAIWNLLIPGTQVVIADESSIPTDRRLMMGEVVPYKQIPGMKAIAIYRFESKPCLQLLAAIPRNALAPSQEGRKLLELFYSRKLWDFGLRQKAPEVETFVNKIILDVMMKAKQRKSPSDTPRIHIPIISTQGEPETMQLMQREGRRHASRISTRFESEGVRRKVGKQYFNAFCDWMVPDVFAAAKDNHEYMAALGFF